MSAGTPTVARQGRDQASHRVRVPNQPRRERAVPGIEGDLLALQRAAGNSAVSRALMAVSMNEAPGPGSSAPLDPDTRAFMELRFGEEFRRVRIHADSRAAKSADAWRARAYTIGEHIVFAAGEFAPRTGMGRALLAHELAHVVQQRRGGPSPFSPPATGLEQDAATAARAAAEPRAGVQVAGASGVGLARQPRSLEETLEPKALRDTDLEYEIAELQAWLISPESYTSEWSNLEAQLRLLEAEALRRQAKQREWRESASWSTGTELAKAAPSAATEVAAAPLGTRKRDYWETIEKIVHEEQEARRHTPATPTSVSELMRYVEQARRMATSEPPDYSRAEALMQSASRWLGSYVMTGKVQDAFYGRGMNMTYASILCGEAYSDVESMAQLLRLSRNSSRPMSDGLWQRAVAKLAAAREYLEVVVGERRYEDSPLAKTGEEATKLGLITLGAGLLLIGGIAAAPLLAAEGALIASALSQAGTATLALVLTNPVAAEAMGLFAVGMVINIVEAGGLAEYAEQVSSSPLGIAQVVYDVLEVYLVVRSGLGQPPRRVKVTARVQSVDPEKGTVKAQVTHVDPNSSAAPPNAATSPAPVPMAPAPKPAVPAPAAPGPAPKPLAAEPAATAPKPQPTAPAPATPAPAAEAATTAPKPQPAASAAVPAAAPEPPVAATPKAATVTPGGAAPGQPQVPPKAAPVSAPTKPTAGSPEGAPRGAAPAKTKPKATSAGRKNDGGTILSESRQPGGGWLIKVKLGAPSKRKGYERVLFPGVQVGLKGWQRAHASGAVFGAESKRGIYYAPEEVNQEFQNKGVETHLRDFYGQKADDVDLVVTVSVKPHEGTSRLKEVTYRLEAQRPDDAKPTRLYEASIEVEDKRDNPKVVINAEQLADYEQFMKPLPTPPPSPETD